MSTSTLAVGNHPITADFTSSNPNTLDSSGRSPAARPWRRPTRRPASARRATRPRLGQSVTFTAQVERRLPGSGHARRHGPVQRQRHRRSGRRRSSTARARPRSPRPGSRSAPTRSRRRTRRPTGTTTASSGSMSQTVERARTTLTYDGATTGDFHDPAVLSATLTRQDDASPVAGKPVHFTMASQSCDGTTNAAGRASCTITPQEPAGDYTVKASFAGDAGNQPSADSKPVHGHARADVAHVHRRHGDRQRRHRARVRRCSRRTTAPRRSPGAASPSRSAAGRRRRAAPR